MTEHAGAQGPDLTQGVELEEIPDGGVLAGYAGDDAVLLYRRGAEVTAVSGTCTHYSGPLGEGLVVGETVRCPWHHACFSLRTGEVLRAPALNPLARWRVAREGGRVRVTGKEEAEPYPARSPAPSAGPRTIVVVGMGAAGSSAVETLLRAGWGGAIHAVEPEADAPYDRPNLSKDFLAGNAPEDWIPLRPAGWYEEHGVVVRREAAIAIDAEARRVRLADGSALTYDALLLAPGAEPVRLTLEGAETPGAPRLHTLRSLADSRSLIEAAAAAQRAVVLGASFIGLEVAASLRARGLEVDVVAPESLPLQRILGDVLGERIRELHEEHGVRFHLGHTAQSLAPGTVVLDDGRGLAAQLVVAGVGVRPRLELARTAGLELDNGVRVDARLRTSVAGIWAAGDVARFPDARTGAPIRVEHWVVAQRQGAAAALDMIGRGADFGDAPFFWSQHYDVPVNYVGHAGAWDGTDVAGDPVNGCAVSYLEGGRVRAVATLFRDRESLEAEVALESGREPGGRAPGG